MICLYLLFIEKNTLSIGATKVDPVWSDVIEKEAQDFLNNHAQYNFLKSK